MGWCTVCMEMYKRRCKSQWKFVLCSTPGHFGSSVVSVFIFTKWIFCLNLTLFLLWFMFVVLPSMIYFPYKDVRQKFRFSNLLDGKLFWRDKYPDQFELSWNVRKNWHSFMKLLSRVPQTNKLNFNYNFMHKFHLKWWSSLWAWKGWLLPIRILIYNIYYNKNRSHIF